MSRRVPATLVAVALLTAFGLIHPYRAEAATLLFSPTAGSYTVGQSFPVTLRLNAAGQAVNAAEGTIMWSSSTLELRSLSTSGSIFKFWPIEPTASGSSSAIFSGGLPTPGYTGSAGILLTLSFRAKATGTATLRLSGGKVLANDGRGTDVFTGSGTAAFSVVAGSTPPTPTAPEPGRPTPQVTSTTHPDPSAWYSAATANLGWTVPAGLTGVSYELSDDVDTVPDQTVETSGTTARIELPADGTWYFHLRGRYDAGWSATAHFALRLDRTPPEPFVPTVEQDRGPTDPSPLLAFATTDTGSGIARYTYRVDDGSTADAASPVELIVPASGSHTATVTAYDQAGNAREGSVAFVTEGYPAPVLLSVSSPLVLLDPLVVRGTANAGDTVMVYVNGTEVGRTVALGGSGERVPWTVGTDRLFRPGSYAVTAIATSPAGQASVATDAKPLRIVGWAFLLNGRLVATLSVLTPVGILLLLLLLLLLAYVGRLVWQNRAMHHRIDTAEDDLEDLRTTVERTGVGKREVEDALERVEEELGSPPFRRRSGKRAGRRAR